MMKELFVVVSFVVLVASFVVAYPTVDLFFLFSLSLLFFYNFHYMSLVYAISPPSWFVTDASIGGGVKYFNVRNEPVQLTCICLVPSFPDPSVSGADGLLASHLGLLASKEVNTANHWIRGLEGPGVRKKYNSRAQNRTLFLKFTH
jgi:hypothetical protein